MRMKKELIYAACTVLLTISSGLFSAHLEWREHKYKFSSEIGDLYNQATKMYNQYRKDPINHKEKNKRFRVLYSRAIEIAKKNSDEVAHGVLLRRLAICLWRLCDPVASVVLDRAIGILKNSYTSKRNDGLEEAIREQLAITLYDSIHVYAAAYNGPKTLYACKEYINCSTDARHKLSAYRYLFTLYFSKNDLESAENLLITSRQIAKELNVLLSPELRNKAKILAAKVALADDPDELLKQAEKNIYKAVEQDLAHQKEATKNIPLFFAIRAAMSERRGTMNKPFEEACKLINNIFKDCRIDPEARHRSKRQIKNELWGQAKRMLANCYWVLSPTYFNNENLPTLQLNDARLKEIKERLKKH
jgi:hypothetical protein